MENAVLVARAKTLDDHLTPRCELQSNVRFCCAIRRVRSERVGRADGDNNEISVKGIKMPSMYSSARLAQSSLQ